MKLLQCPKSKSVKKCKECKGQILTKVNNCGHGQRIKGLYTFEQMFNKPFTSVNHLILRGMQ